MTLDAWLQARRQEREQAGLHRRLSPRGPDEPLVDLAGNDYLGLATHPEVVAAARDAALRWGAGAKASRLVTGTTSLHVELETALASFTRRPAALVFSTGYVANLAAVAALSDPDTLIISDAHVHASLVDACRLARRSRVVVTPHNDLDAVAAALASRAESRAMVLCESVYSVLGDAAPLAELVKLTAVHEAVLVVDEAHALGVAGPGGRGLVAALGADAPSLSHLVVTVTLSKSLGSQGGAVLATPPVVEHLVNTARTFIFDTGLAPPAAAAALAALQVLRREPERPQRALGAAARICAALSLQRPAGAVLSIPMADPEVALKAQERLRSAGFAVGCFRPPSVPDGVSRLRFTGKADLDGAGVDRLIAELAAAGVEQ